MSKLQGAISQVAANLTGMSATLADGATDADTIALVGVSVGDPAFVSVSDATAGTIAQAFVSAADVVTVEVVNASGGAADVSDINVVVAVLH